MGVAGLGGLLVVLRWLGALQCGFMQRRVVLAWFMVVWRWFRAWANQRHSVLARIDTSVYTKSVMNLVDAKASGSCHTHTSHDVV